VGEGRLGTDGSLGSGNDRIGLFLLLMVEVIFCGRSTLYMGVNRAV
jgi:hypothetical protein